jgi:cysteine sulfinate desulfinase/cysteine desulfurase-like protein
MKKPIYLDYNATTPHDPEVIEAMRPFFEEEFGNPSSSHHYGRKPKQAVELPAAGNHIYQRGHRIQQFCHHRLR